MSAEELTFVEKYDLFGCIQCGRCTGGCPVTVRTPLNVRTFVYNAKSEDELEGLSQEESVWDCTTCWTCASRCPKGLEPLEVLIGLRGIQIEEGQVQPTLRDALQSVFQDGNPWGSPKAKRNDWMEGLDVRVIEPEEEEATDVMLFFCCTDAYDSRVQKVAKALISVMKKANVDFGVMGEAESCCGSEVRRVGEEGLFEMCFEENSETMNAYNVNRIVCISPHCFTTFKKEYPELKIPVLHYTELLAELIDEGKFKIEKKYDGVLAYHDPCFLGKQADVYEAPRKVIGAIPDVDFREFDRCKERSLCCEGGGGKMWVEGESKEERLAEVRVLDAKNLEADTLLVACPFCLLTLEDASKVKGLEEELRVADILELLEELIGE